MSTDDQDPLLPDYAELIDVLERAVEQAAIGKGNERHATGQPFVDQPMQQLISLYGPGFALGQAAKKSQEAMRLPRDRAVRELLGAINYIAGAVIAIEADPQPAANDNDDAWRRPFRRQAQYIADEEDQ